MEPLEERQMLAVTPGFTSGMFDQIKAENPELSLGNFSDYQGTADIVALDAATLVGMTTAQLQAELTRLAGAAGNDIIVIDTGNDSTTFNLGAALNISNATGSITILTTGDGSLSLNGQGQNRIFNLTSSTVQLAGLTIENGSAGNGGGISSSESTLTLSGVTLTGNRATAGQGGAIYQDRGTSTLYNVVMAGNTASAEGGAMAIVQFRAASTIVNSTFVGNNSTGTNYAGLYSNTASSSTISVSNSIFWNNSNKMDVYLNAAGTRIFMNNLVSDASKLSSPSIGKDVYYGDPKLDGDYRLTEASTNAIDKGDNSELAALATDIDGESRIYNGTVDLGANEWFCIEVTTLEDQYDANPYDNGLSLREAIDVAAARAKPIVFASDILGNADSGVIELTLGELVIDSSVDIRGLVDGEGENLITIDGDGGRVFNVSAPKGAATAIVVSLKNLDVTGGILSGVDGGAFKVSGKTDLIMDGLFVYGNMARFGGAVYVDGTDGAVLTVHDTCFSGNTTTNSGGAIHAVYGAVINVTGDSLFTSNMSGDCGGAICLVAKAVANVTSADVVFTDNSAVYGGAFGLFINSKLTVVDGVTIEFNTSSSNGGAINAMDSEIVLGAAVLADNVVVAGNGNGGAIWMKNTKGTLNNTEFNNNEAKFGGAVLVTDRLSVLTANGADFTENESSASGGAIHVINNGKAVINDGTQFVGNTAGSWGGAICAVSGGVVEVLGTTVEFSKNSAESGGAIGATNRSSVTIADNVKFTDNTAVVYGGAISQFDSSLKVGAAEFFGNKVTAGNGGAIYLNNAVASTLKLNGTKFVGNTSSKKGGAIYTRGTTTADLVDIVMSENSATNGGNAFAAPFVDTSLTLSITEKEGSPLLESSPFELDNIDEWFLALE